MSVDLEDLLREALAEKAASARYIPDLFDIAHRRHRRRRVVARAILGCGTLLVAAVGGFGATVLVHGPAPASPLPQALTVAYVTSHVQAALAQSPDSIVHVVSDVEGRLVETWEDPASEVMHVKAYSAAGVLLEESTWGLSGSGSSPVVTSVDPAHQSWWIETLPAPPLNQVLTPLKVDGSAPQPAVALAPPLTADLINTGLSNGRLKVMGQDVTGGQQSVHLALAPTSGLPLQRVEMWVDAVTFQPLRMVTTATATSSQQVFTWLPRTQDNLATLQIEVPTGYVRLKPPPGALPVQVPAELPATP